MTNAPLLSAPRPTVRFRPVRSASSFPHAPGWARGEIGDGAAQEAARVEGARARHVTTLCIRPPPRVPLPAPEWNELIAARCRARRSHRATASPLSPTAPPLPLRRGDLIFRPLGDDGTHVVKDRLTGGYFNLGPQESFLFAHLDGRSSAGDVRGAFERRFGEPLTEDDVNDFLTLARESHFFDAPSATHIPATAPSRAPQGQSILYWRKSAFDPDRLFDWLAPKLRIVWTRAFLILSAAFICCAVVLVWMNARELVTRFPHVMRWETFALAWVTLVAATTLHEFAHGLTCKHFGGEVHEVGFLMLFFIPCFYCNVSDAWLFREKSKRLWVTLAGGYCDLLAWAAAAFVWRLTAQDSIVNYLAWVILSVLGVRNFFNFNPLLKLDGYYLLSDAIELPNLRQRGWERFMGHARWLLWGAPRPAAEPRGRFLLAFGTAAWGYSAMFAALMTVAFLWFLRDRWGHAGTALALALGVLVTRGSFEGFSNGEFRTMIKTRYKHMAVLAAALLVTVALLVLVRIERRASGSFQVRSVARADVRAPASGFLQSVSGDEGDRVVSGALVAQLEIPDLETRLAQKRAAVLQSEATIRLLRAGPRNSGSARTPLEAEIRAAEIDAERARMAQVQAEVHFLQAQQKRLLIHAPVSGLIVTPHLRDRVGQFLKEGELICQIEEPAELEIEITLDEQEATDVALGQRVELKARALPFDTFYANVQRLAPAAVHGDVQSKLTVYCTLNNPSLALRPGMSGHARIACGRRPIGEVFFGRILRTVRTEFWW